MAKRKKLSVEEVARLGADRLASLICAAAEDDPALLRKLRVTVASQSDATAAAQEIVTQVKALRRSRSLIDSRRLPSFVRDLQSLIGSIEGPLAEANPALALELMFDLIEVAPAVVERCEDREGRMGDVFRGACESAAELTSRAAASLPPIRAAQRAYRVYMADGYGVADSIIAAFAKVLEPEARSEMRSWVEADLGKVPAAAPDDPSAAGRLSEWKLLNALADLADADGDVDAYCAVQQRFGPRVRDDAGMAKRLLEAGRATEALLAVDAALPNPAKNSWQLADLRIAALDALSRHDEAQAMRWAQFTGMLRMEPLREFLKRLPAFEDFDKEQEALDLAAGVSDPHRALDFLIKWPDLKRAGAVVRERHTKFDGNCYWLLTPAADALSAVDPLAACLLYRRMIEFTLDHARSSRYGHAAEHLGSCAWLSKSVGEWQGHVPHADYVANLRERHPRKVGFWSRVDAH